MKNLFLAFSLFTSIVAQGQTVATVPNNIGFVGMNVQLDNDAKAIVQADVKALMTNKKYWEATLDRCLMYFPIIEGVLIDEDVPIDIKYLAVQESSLQPDAASASQAVGFWQFKKETALDFGLRADDDIDERKNINASTHAAAKYLKKSNLQFNNWVSALYSYYLGAGAIAKLIPTEWAYAKEIRLTKDTDKYLLRFFAHKIAIESSIERYQPSQPTVLVEYPKAGGRTLESIAKELDIEPSLVNSYNRWTKNDIPTDREYTATIPAPWGQVEGVKAKIAAFKTPNARDNFTQTDIGFPIMRRAENVTGDAIFYVINGLPGIMAVRGDTPASLAQKGKVSFSSFLRYNDMGEQDEVQLGKVYYLDRKAKKAAVPFHTVREGENLWEVSQIYGVRLKKLLRNNRIPNKTQKLQTGRVLWLTARRPRNTPVEVVNQPQQELFPQQPSRAKMSEPRPAAAKGEKDGVNNDIPKDKSERKVYTPKMADEPQKEARTSAETKNTKPTEAKPSRRAPSFNPDGNSQKSEGGGYEITGDEPKNTKPKEKASAEKPKNVEPKVEAKKEEVIAAKNPQTQGVTHVVEAGQTFYSISKMYDVSVKDILYWNDLTENSSLKSGQKLIIKPVGATTTPSQPATAEKEVIRETVVTTHTVEVGETAYKIAQKYGIKVKELLEWNGLTDDFKVQVGQKLRIKPPEAKPETTTAVPEFISHTVDIGETMFSISQKYGVKIDQVKEWNGLTSNDVKVGQKLKIKKP